MLKVEYVGGKYRQAFISFDEKDEKRFTRISFLMHIKGWEIEQCDMSGSCKVFDKDEYNQFMEDWKESKKEERYEDSSKS